MGSIVMGGDRNAVSTQCKGMHYGIPALWHLGVIGRQRRVERRTTSRAAAAIADDLVDADGAEHVVHPIAKPSRWAVVVRALHAHIRRDCYAVSRRGGVCATDVQVNARHQVTVTEMYCTHLSMYVMVREHCTMLGFAGSG